MFGLLGLRKNREERKWAQKTPSFLIDLGFVFLFYSYKAWEVYHLKRKHTKEVHSETSHVTNSVRHSLYRLEKIHSCQDSRWIFLFFLRKQRLPLFNLVVIFFFFLTWNWKQRYKGTIKCDSSCNHWSQSTARKSISKQGLHPEI